MENMRRPLVSIVLPCYNHEQFIEKAIYSLIEQRYENIELIIIDDGSIDNSVDIIKKIEPLCVARFKRFEFRHRSNKGLSFTLNEGIEWAKGYLWTTCSSDDYYHQDKVACQVDFMLEKDLQYCITEAAVVDDTNKMLSKNTKNYNSKLGSNITFEDIFTFKTHLPVTGMYKLHFLKNVLGGFDSTLMAEDYDMNLKIISHTSIGIINRKLYYYRSPHVENSSRSRRPMRRDVSESHLKTMQKYSAHPEFKQAYLEWNFRRFVSFSPYKDSKIYALKGMLLSLTKINTPSFHKSLFNLLFVWRS